MFTYLHVGVVSLQHGSHLLQFVKQCVVLALQVRELARGTHTCTHVLTLAEIVGRYNQQTCVKYQISIFHEV